MNIERLIALIVKTVVEELTRQGIIHPGTSTTRLQQDQYEKAETSTGLEKPDIHVVGCHVISEQIVLEVLNTGCSILEIPSNALITPLAEDTAKQKGIRIQRGK